MKTCVRLTCVRLTCVRLTCVFADDYRSLIPIQLFIGWHNRAGNGNTRHLGLVFMITHAVLVLVLVLGLRNTHLNCRLEWVFRYSFDAYNVVNQMLCFFQILSDPVLRRLPLFLLLTRTRGHLSIQFFQLLGN